jgi:hypothetical protein
VCPRLLSVIIVVRVCAENGAARAGPEYAARESEDQEGLRSGVSSHSFSVMCLCVCVCVCERERERERLGVLDTESVCVFVFVCVFSLFYVCCM